MIAGRDSRDTAKATGTRGVAYDWLLSWADWRTIRRAWLGWNDEWREVLPLQSRAGITIPSFVDGRLWYVNVRLGMLTRRSTATVSVPSRFWLSSLYGADALNSSPPVAILVEGEFDAVASAVLRPGRTR